MIEQLRSQKFIVDYYGSNSNLSVLIAVALVLERYLGVPGSHAHTADGWLYTSLIILVWILLVHLQYTGTDVVRHHVLDE